jgi:hypothetical protein
MIIVNNSITDEVVLLPPYFTNKDSASFKTLSAFILSGIKSPLVHAKPLPHTPKILIIEHNFYLILSG